MNPIHTIRLFAVSLALAACGVAHAQGTPVLGAAAPAFRLQDQNGKWHELADYRGKWVALYFCPRDQTPGCTTQASEFRDNSGAFRDAGAVILSVSVDDVEAHRKFAEQHNLPFTLLADSTKETAKKYGVLKSYLGALELAKRDTFLIDTDGRIVKHYADVIPKGHSSAVLSDLKALQQKKAG